jgi:hypothetical protein
MTRKMAECLATVLGGEFVAVMPESRKPGILFNRPDGRLVAIDADPDEWGGGYLFPSRTSYDRYHVEGSQDDLLDVAEWGSWGSRAWAEGLAFVLGGTANDTGGNIWTVDVTRVDGHHVCIGLESASVFPTADDFAAMNDGDAVHYEWV